MQLKFRKIYGPITMQSSKLSWGSASECAVYAATNHVRACIPTNVFQDNFLSAYHSCDEGCLMCCHDSQTAFMIMCDTCRRIQTCR